MSIHYKAIVSSDWSECLSPCGPFDFIAFNYPPLKSQLADIFRQYTGNRIALAQAVDRITGLLPDRITPEEMDAYLDDAFETYTGVADLIDWCLTNDILFMINTTGMIGFFQRAFARGLLPRVPVLSAHPMVRYPGLKSDPPSILNLLEITDKSQNTAAVVQSSKIPPGKIILMGDSGGDGPHFEWGFQKGAFLIGSMTKSSLDDFCRRRGITIDLRFGADYTKDTKRNIQKEMQINFMDLATVFEEILNIR
jgi:hypothetical protein